MSYRYQHGDRPLDGYTILRGIGRGGFGEVYYALSDGGREVALKVIQQNHDIELRGIQHCINLKSPHLVSIFDVKSDSSGSPYVIMEYVAGPSLRDLLRDAPKGLGVDKALFLVHEIAKGLGYLHERGIVHRDLKPENIFFEDGYVKIGDYGLSKYISMSRQSGQTISVGTVHYMAPEIGSGHYHHGIDVYALGIIFYELLTGDVPFNGDSMGEILMKHLTADPDLAPIPEAFRPIIARSLAKKPDERYPNARAMIEDLLAAGDAARRLEAFNPVSLTTCPVPAAGEGVRREPPAPPEGRFAPEPRPAAPPSLPSPFRSEPREAVSEPRPVAAESEPGPAEAGRVGAGDLQQRVVHATITVVAMAFALSLLKDRGPSMFGSYSLFFGGLAALICLAQSWLAPRFDIRPGIGRRLAAVGLSAPVLFLGEALFVARDTNNLPFLALGGIFLMDWDLRTRVDRPEQVSFQLAFSAGLLGLILAALLRVELILGIGTLAALSLTVGALSPFAPFARGSAPRRGPAGRQGSRFLSRRRGRHPHRAATPAPAGGAAHRGAAPAGAAAATGAFGATAGGPSPLARPIEDRILAGVCAGIARRYGWEVVWLRVAFILGALFSGGAAIPVYIVLWICMPNQLPRGGVGRPIAAAPVGTAVARAFLVVVAAGAAVFGVYLVVGWLAHDGSGPQGVAIATAPRVTLLAVLGLAAVGAAILSGVIVSRRGRGRPAEAPPRAPSGSSGWTAFGALLLVVSVVFLIALALLHSQAGLELSREIPDARPWIDAARASPLPVLAGLVLLGLGIVSLLVGRRSGGAVHVLRGALGWSLAALLALLLVRVAPALGSSGHAGGVHISPLGLLVIAGLAVLSLSLIVWPRPRGISQEVHPVEAIHREPVHQER